MLRTRVGYTGGKMPSPDYHDLKDHCETTQIQFDSRVVGYSQLLQTFWERHNYATKIPHQYKSAIFYNDDGQREEAEASLARVKKGQLGQARFNEMAVQTVILPATTFYIAELYHQKYFLQCNRELFRLLMYKRREDLLDDPVATSLNGYLHGSGTVEALMAEVDSWTLPFVAKLALLRHVAGEGQHLGGFKPIDESGVHNPTPGAFDVSDNIPDLESVPTATRLFSGSKCHRDVGGNEFAAL